MSLSSASARAEATGFASTLPRTVRKSPVTPGLRSSRAVPCLATVPPRYRNSKADVETAESGGHDPVVPRLRGEQGQGSGEHEAEAHHGYDLDRERTTSDDGRTIEKQPHPGNRFDQT